MANGDFLRKEAWDYFAAHASQRMTIFNFYIALSSVVATGYFSSFKADSNLQDARWVLASLLCLFAFIFWRLDGRNKFLIKNAEKALRHFEQSESGDPVAKVFTHEDAETYAMRRKMYGLGRVVHLSYSDCFNLVYAAFASIGVYGTLQASSDSLHCAHWYGVIGRLFLCKC